MLPKRGLYFLSAQRGRLLDRSGTLIEQVVVERGTPGVVESASLVGAARGGHSIEVSFAVGAPLRFAVRRSDGAYALAAPSSGGLFDELLAELGWSPKPKAVTVMFAGLKWKAVAGTEARLLIERDALGQIARRQRVLEGVRIR